MAITGNPKWIGDSSEGGNLHVTTSAASSSITFASATQGTPFNMRLDTHGAPMGKSYYEVKVTNMSKGASLGVGLVTADGFQPGWKTKGCFYNGNITNGSAGLIIGFGKFIKEGDVVGVYHQRSASGDDDTTRQCNIIFFHNGRCLGTGFSLDGNNEKFFPCLHLSGSATVEFSIPPSPTVYEREQAVQNDDDPYSGDWVIEQAFVGPELAELPLPAGSRFKVSFEKINTTSSTEGNVQYQLFIKISNSFHTSFAVTGKMEAFDKIEFLTTHCMSTIMMPIPAFAEVEQLIQTAMDSDGGWRKMIVTEEGQLIMSGRTAEIICPRYAEIFEPVRSLFR